MLFIRQESSPGSFTRHPWVPKSCKTEHVPKLKHVSSLFSVTFPVAPSTKAAQKAQSGLRGGKMTLPLDGKSCEVPRQRDRDTRGEELCGHLWPITTAKAAISLLAGLWQSYPEAGTFEQGRPKGIAALASLAQQGG